MVTSRLPPSFLVLVPVMKPQPSLHRADNPPHRVGKRNNKGKVFRYVNVCVKQGMFDCSGHG